MITSIIISVLAHTYYQC